MTPPLTIRPYDEHLGCYLLTLPALAACLEAGLNAGYASDPFCLGVPLTQGAPLTPTATGLLADRYVEATARYGARPPRRRYKLDVEPTQKFAGATVVTPWARAENKRAPFTWWREYLTGKSYALQAPAEGREYAEQFLREVPGGVFDSADDAAIWVDDLAGARRVVSVDTGSAHMADALGVPTTTVFATTDPALFTPYWSRDFVEAG